MVKQVSRSSRRKANESEPLGGALDRVKKGHAEVAIEIETLIRDEAIRGLLNDWLVPMIVDLIIKELGS
jgi:hypothetical protein